MPSKVYLLSRDLLFISRIKEEASRASVEMQTVKSFDALRGVVQDLDPEALMLVDLEKSFGTLEQIEGELRTALSKGSRCVFYFSHVHEELREGAVAAGLGEVMPRSRFVKVLPELLRS